MSYETEVRIASPRSLAVIRERMAPSEIPKRVMPMLDRAYAALKDAQMKHDGQNVFVYRGAGGGLVDVETGVGVDGPFAPHGDLVHVVTPSGPAVTTTHWGSDFARLPEAHGAIRAWFAEHSRKAGNASWEVYGHWTGDPAAMRTDVFYLVAPETP